MLRSLVGSEMCIRDSPSLLPQQPVQLKHKHISHSASAYCYSLSSPVHLLRLLKSIEHTMWSHSGQVRLVLTCSSDSPTRTCKLVVEDNDIAATSKSVVETKMIVQCFMSPPTQYRLYGRRFLQVKRPNQQYQSTEVLSTQKNQTHNNQTINTKHRKSPSLH